MSVMADDLINFTSMLRMSYNFLAGRDFLKKKKFREKKKLISVALPFSDLAFAAGGVPVFPIRMEIFSINNYSNCHFIFNLQCDWINSSFLFC